VTLDDQTKNPISAKEVERQVLAVQELTPQGLAVRLDFASPRPIYQQIIDEVKRAIARGELNPGSKLPSQRELAEQARENPNTVQRAFREMEASRLVETLRGQGTFVSSNPDLLHQVRMDMAEMAIGEFVEEIRRLNLGLDDAMQMLRRYWNEKDGAQSEVQG
jgi:GntR family transcriptional regulator